MTVTINGTTGIAGVDGSASTPAMQGSDTNTGVFFPAADTVAISTGGTERARVDSSGNVGIGVTPSAWSASSFKAIQVNAQGSYIAGTSSFYSAGSYLYIGNNGYDDTGNGFKYSISQAAAQYVQVGNSHQWKIAASGTAGNAITFTQAMTLDASGYLLVGYTSSNGAYKLQVNSQIFATSSTIATSDGKYKENVQTLEGALDLVKALRPVQFSWKQHPVHAFDTTTPIVGFIAQEVQQVLANKPYLNSIIKSNECVIEPEEKDEEGNVTKEVVKEDFLGIAEGNMIALLTAAIKEQQTLIQSLTDRISTLENK